MCTNLFQYQGSPGSRWKKEAHFLLTGCQKNALLKIPPKCRFSIFSEEKARLLREVGDMVEDKDAELAVFLSSLKLEEIPNPGDHIALPPEVIGKALLFLS